MFLEIPVSAVSYFHVDSELLAHGFDSLPDGAVVASDTLKRLDGQVPVDQQLGFPPLELVGMVRVPLEVAPVDQFPVEPAEVFDICRIASRT